MAEAALTGLKMAAVSQCRSQRMAPSYDVSRPRSVKAIEIGVGDNYSLWVDCDKTSQVAVGV